MHIRCTEYGIRPVLLPWGAAMKSDPEYGQLGCLQTTQRYNPYDSNLLIHHCENLKYNSSNPVTGFLICKMPSIKKNFSLRANQMKI
jgi:hypothetical protein